MDEQPVTVRFPPQTYENIKNRAKAHLRSFNKEVLVLLAQGISVEESADIETLKKILADQS